MASNEFNKEERVAFEYLLEGFDNALVPSKNATIYRNADQMYERTGDIIWRPMPYISRSFDGADQTANFKSKLQMSVPATIGFYKNSLWTLDAKELRDQLQEGRLGDSAKQILASDINTSVLNVASNQGTLVVKIVGALTGYDDVAECDAVMNEQGVMMNDRRLFLATRSYNSMASNLAARQNLVSAKTLNAYERSLVGTVAGFETFKMDVANSIGVAAGAGITMDTQAAATNYHVPKATTIAATGEKSNYDNRYQTITVSDTTGVVAGDCFTIAGVNALHHITKGDTGQLKTFRVISNDSATTLTISPPVISAQGGSDEELDYQNVSVTPSATAALVFLNTAAAPINPFWHKDAIELLPSRLAIPSDAGVAVMRGTVDNGIEVVWTKFFDINTHVTKYRCAVLYGVCNKQPEMSGILIGSQV